eukprot:1195258-Prorocentrum_minimum.AAC.1
MFSYLLVSVNPLGADSIRILCGHYATTLTDKLRDAYAAFKGSAYIFDGWIGLNSEKNQGKTSNFRGIFGGYSKNIRNTMYSYTFSIRILLRIRIRTPALSIRIRIRIRIREHSLADSIHIRSIFWYPDTIRTRIR